MPVPTTDPDCILRLIRQWLEWNGGIDQILAVASVLGVGYHTIRRAIRKDRGQHLEVIGHSVRLKDGKK